MTKRDELKKADKLLTAVFDIWRKRTYQYLHKHQELWSDSIYKFTYESARDGEIRRLLKQSEDKDPKTLGEVMDFICEVHIGAYGEEVESYKDDAEKMVAWHKGLSERYPNFKVGIEH